MFKISFILFLVLNCLTAFGRDCDSLPDNFLVVEDTDEIGVFRSGLISTDEQLECIKERFGITTFVSFLGAGSSDGPIMDWEVEAVARAELDYHVKTIEVRYNTSREVMGQIYTLFERARSGEERILFHCKHGRDRTGIVMAIYKERYGLASEDDAYDEYRRYRSFYVPALTNTVRREFRYPSDPVRL